MFGTSGIRGPVGETVTADLALAVGRALAVDTERVVIGRDARDSGAFLADALAAGCLESGTDVVDLGRAATPTVARAVAWTDADAGAMITASHNPPPDNGIKLWHPSGQAFDADRRETVADRVERGEAHLVGWDAVGERTTTDAHDRHVAAVTDAVDAPAESPSVVVDLGNGVGGVTVDALRVLGADVETLNAQPDGSFPGRPSEPTAEHCTSLATLVGAGDATLGLAHDGDADRLRAVAADGTFVSGDALLAVFARTAASAGERVVVPVDTSLAVADHLAAADVEVTYTPVGDVYVAEAATADDVAFGGEPSGAWIWPDETLCPDGPLAAAKLLALHAERPLGERVADVPTYPIRRASIDVADDRKKAAVASVREAARDRFGTEDVTTLDGVRVEREDGWFLVRASGTQPLVRLTAEARDADRADALLETARTLLDDALA